MEMTWGLLRVKRNRLLEETDKTQLPDFPIDTKTRALYKEYRSYLRNVPALYDDSSVKTAKIFSFDEWLKIKKSGNMYV